MNKVYLTLSILICSIFGLSAACGPGQSEVIITIVPDNYPQETSWSLRDAITNALIDSGRVNSDTVCIGSSQCVRFRIYDSASDGLCCGYGLGSYNIKLNGIVITSGGQFGASETTTFNCAPGYSCSSPITAAMGTMTAPSPDSWYVFTPDTTGRYDINTCALGNTCDTKLYIYDRCSGLVFDENNQGTVFYNDDDCANLQARIQASLTAGVTYYIRVGDYQTSCAGRSITWQILFQGPVIGCMDTASCNYNPLATVDTGGCIYPPSPLCAAPDLVVLGSVIESSLTVADLTVGANNCYIGEGCLTGYGVRRLIRFTTHIKNIGNLDYYIGAPNSGGNQFTYDACHNHWHYVGYAEYLLYDQNYQPVQAGYKNGFCVLDLECSGGGQAKFGCSNMGITAGCGDIYASGLDCQWIDITDVDTGNYTLVVRVNWDRSPDKLGHYESRYDNNWAQVCLRIYYDQSGQKVFNQLPNCAIYVDCVGDTLGNAVTDCAGVCNGTNVRGDVDVNLTTNITDVNLYQTGITNETIGYSTCNDLNGDNLITITDAARLNACLRYDSNQHQHPVGGNNNHKHCEFPFNIVNIYDTVTIAIADTNLVQHYVDLSIHNPTARVIAYEFKLHGLRVDSVKNLATGNYVPVMQSSPTGHITGISIDENSLFRQVVPLNFMRVYFSALTDTQICVSEVIAVVNSDYDEVISRVGGNCFNVSGNTIITDLVSEVEQLNDLSIVPNPNNGVFDIYLTNKSLFGAEIQVLDPMGRIVYRNLNNTGLSNSVKIDLGEQQSGMYAIHLKSNGRSLTKRLMIVK
jgi:hypothetical protein